MKTTLHIEIRLSSEETEKLKKWEDENKTEIEDLIRKDVIDFIKTMGKR